jgi:hypothetical protein
VNTNFAYSRPSMPALMNSIKLKTSISSSCSLSNCSMRRNCSIESAKRGGADAAGRALDQSK